MQREGWLLKPRSATTHFVTPGKRSRSGLACGSSSAWPGARMKARAAGVEPHPRKPVP